MGFFVERKKRGNNGVMMEKGGMARVSRQLAEG
jgi:hypothetical protein